MSHFCVSRQARGEMQQRAVLDFPRMITIVLGAALAASLMLLLTGTKVLQEYERGIVFRFGRAKKTLASPGFNLLLPLGIDRIRVVDVRTRAIQITPRTSSRATTSRSASTPSSTRRSARRCTPCWRSRTTCRRRCSSRRRRCGPCWARWRWTTSSPTATRSTTRSADPGHAHRAVGRGDLGGRDQGHPVADGDAAGDGPPGGGRARTARQGDRRRGRGAGRVQAGAGGRDDCRAPGRAAAPALSDAGRGRGRGVVDDRVPGADRSGRCRHGRVSGAGAVDDADRAGAGGQAGRAKTDRGQQAR